MSATLTRNAGAFTSRATFAAGTRLAARSVHMKKWCRTRNIFLSGIHLSALDLSRWTSTPGFGKVAGQAKGEDARMAFVRAADLTVHYDLVGPSDRPTIMFANSLGTNFHVWDPQARSLGDRFRILRYDMRGHGLTDCPPVPEGSSGYTIDQLADDALALLDVLGIRQVHFCGLSIGGMVGQRLAAKAPDRVISLVLCDTASRIGPPSLWDERISGIRKSGLGGIAQGVLARWFTPRFLADHADAARGFANMLTRTPADGYIGCCLAIRDADLRPDDANIKCPTLVVVGDQDAATPPEAARELCAAIAGARLEIVPGAAHIPTAEQPERLNEILNAFFATAATPLPAAAKGGRP